MNALQKIDEVRDARARNILAEARANIVGHLSRDERVAAAIKLARLNIIRLDPRRLAPTREEQLQRAAAAARQKRVKRTLNDAHATLTRLARLEAPLRKSNEIVHKSIGDTRAEPTSPSPTPRRQTERPSPAEGIDALGHRLEILREAIPEVVAHLRDEFRHDDDLLRREIDVMRRELDLSRHDRAMSETPHRRIR